MNETNGPVRIDNETGSIIYPPTRPFFEIAEYLSERGFAVLQYDKRGIGSNPQFWIAIFGGTKHLTI